MSEHPILFTGASVRAILDGSKTQTRRVVKAPDWWEGHLHHAGVYDVEPPHTKRGYHDILCARSGSPQKTCPYGEPGEAMWVRETWRVEAAARGGTERSGYRYQVAAGYRAASRYTETCIPFGTATEGQWRQACHYYDKPGGWCPSIFMPKWACRLRLTVEGVRVERVQDISEEDAHAEGCSGGALIYPEERVTYHRGAFKRLWNSINAKRGYSFEATPWVWAVTFRKQEKAA